MTNSYTAIHPYVKICYMNGLKSTQPFCMLGNYSTELVKIWLVSWVEMDKVKEGAESFAISILDSQVSKGMKKTIFY